MIDLGVSKLALIAVVALIVVGPERLPANKLIIPVIIQSQ